MQTSVCGVAALHKERGKSPSGLLPADCQTAKKYFEALQLQVSHKTLGSYFLSYPLLCCIARLVLPAWCAREKPEQPGH